MDVPMPRTRTRLELQPWGNHMNFFAWQEYCYVCYIWILLPGLTPGSADGFRARLHLLKQHKRHPGLLCELDVPGQCAVPCNVLWLLCTTPGHIKSRRKSEAMYDGSCVLTGLNEKHLTNMASVLMRETGRVDGQAQARLPVMSLMVLRIKLTAIPRKKANRLHLQGENCEDLGVPVSRIVLEQPAAHFLTAA